jgi:hypothetical protein
VARRGQRVHVPPHQPAPHPSHHVVSA